MAKRTKTIEEFEESTITKKDISGMLKLLRKTTNSVSAEDSPYNKVSHFIDTGSYAMNYLISGDFFKGIPAGKVVLISGETGTLKTIQALRLAANALNNNNYDMIFYVDTEGGAPYDTLKHMGCDPSKVEHVLAENVEDATVKIMAIYGNIKTIKEQYPDFKALIICDSIGGLNAQKFQNDVDAGVQKVDQGNRARLINALVRGCTIPALTTDCTIIFINHIYEGPSGPFAVSKIKDQGGGKGLQYLASISIQCTKLLQKNAAIKMRGEDADRSVESFYSGSVFKFFSVKNRLVRPFLEVPVYVDFASGFGGMKYLGIVGLAKKYGFIDDGKPGCYLVLQGPHKDKQIKRAELISSGSDEIWNTFIYDLNAKASADANYGADQPKDEDLNVAVDSIEEMERDSISLADVD